MFCNPDPTKPAQEVIVSKKNKIQTYPIISFNNVQVPYQKHEGILLDEKLNFKQHVDGPILKMNKGISVIKNVDMAYHKIHY